MKMKILLINHYAGSPSMGMEFRPYYFAKEWIKKGHHVDIISANYSHLRRVNPSVKKDFQRENIDGINYYWIKTNNYDKNGVKRSLTMFEFITKLWIHSKWIVDNLKPDVVICSSTYPLDTYVGQRIRKISKKPVKLIHEVHDMWPISPIEIGGMSPKNPFIMLMQRGEDSFCKHSDKVVSLLPAAKEYFIKHGMDSNKFRHISNGIVLEEWEHYEKIPFAMSERLKAEKEKGKFVLCFFGSIHKTYNLDILIRAVKKIRQPILVCFIGSGLDKCELQKMTKGFEDKFIFFDPISKTSIPDLFNYIDATFVGAKSQKIFRFGICMNKLFDAMMGGKPILYMVDAPNNYVNQYDCGITVAGQDEKSLVSAIEELMSLNQDKINCMGENGREAARKDFSYPKLAQKFLDVMMEE